MSNDTKKIPGFAGQNWREVPPKIEPKPEAPKPAAEGAPAYTGHARAYEASTSKSSRLLPFAREISTGLDGAMTRERLEAAVLGGFLSPQEAETIAKATGLKP